jgi:type VI secretion system protein ImpH
MADLIERLKEEQWEFNFFQAVSLLEEYFREKGVVEDILDSGRIRFDPDCAMTFPPNDIAEISEKEGAIRFLLSFMSLLGVSSPLPVYFTEQVMLRPEESEALRDFISVFNHRLYVLFYRAWKKYHFMRTFSPRGNDPFTQKIGALAGMNPNRMPPKDRVRLIAYTGILAGKYRSAAGLETVLSDFFGAIPVQVRQWMPRWAALQNPAKMGDAIRLGKNAMCGTSVLDFSGKIRVVLGPLRREIYERFLPGSDNIATVKKLVTEYCADPIEADIEVKLQSTELIPVILSHNNTRLGETSSLGTSDQKSHVQSIIIE